MRAVFTFAALVFVLFAVQEAVAQVEGRGSEAAGTGPQIGFGGQISYAFEDEALGLGLRSEFFVQPVPIVIALSGDRYFPRCGAVGCSLWQLHANGKLDLGWLLPLSPFIGGGLNHRRFSLSGPLGENQRNTDNGINILAGVWRGQTFLEARYEMQEDIDDQVVLSIGILF